MSVPPNAVAWATGQKTVAQIDADSTAFLVNWPWNGGRWAVDTPAVINMSVRESVALDGSPRDFGLINTTLSLMVPTAAMVGYIITNRFATNGRFENTHGTFAAATLRLYSIRRAAWLTINFDKAVAPRESMDAYQPRNGKMPYVVFRFFDGVIAASGA